MKHYESRSVTQTQSIIKRFFVVVVCTCIVCSYNFRIYCHINLDYTLLVWLIVFPKQIYLEIIHWDFRHVEMEFVDTSRLLFFPGGLFRLLLFL